MRKNWIRTICVQAQWRNPTVIVSRVYGERYYGHHYGITDATVSRLQRLFNSFGANVYVDIENSTVTLLAGA